MKRFAKLLFFLSLQALVACAGPAAAHLGLWVECQGKQRTLDSKEKIVRMVERAASIGADRLYVQVYRGGEAFYESYEVPAAHLASEDRPAPFDPLGVVLAEATKRGIEVHGWVNVFSLARNRDGRVARRLGPEAFTRDNRGRSILDYPEGGGGVPPPDEGTFLTGTNHLWLDPGVPAVRGQAVRVILELAERYPDLAGVHLDFVRYPYHLPIRPVSRLPVGLDFGYASEAVRLFEEETGLPAPLEGRSKRGANRWDEWRRRRVTLLLEKIRERLRPDLELSAAVLPWADRAYLSAFQDWRGWLDEGLVDAVVLMNYSRDGRLVDQDNRAALPFRGPGRKILAGLGAYVMTHDLKALEAQIDTSYEAGLDGVVLFSYDALVEDEGVWEELEGVLGE